MKKAQEVQKHKDFLETSRTDNIDPMKSERSIDWPDLWTDEQEKELEEMFDPEFEVLLSSLDRKLSQIHDEDLAHYLILVMLRDPDDPEAEQLINDYAVKYGPIEKIIH